MKTHKKAKTVLLIAVGMLVLLLATVYLNHRIRSAQEAVLLKPWGQLVELDCPHYVHDYECAVINRGIRDFLTGIPG